MYLSNYKMMGELFNTIYEAILYCKNSSEPDNIIVLKDCIDGIDTIKNIIGLEKNIIEVLKGMDGLIIKLNEMKKKVEQGEKIVEAYDEVLGLIESIFNQVQQNIDVKLKVAFLPYKAAMWTALESVWHAAHKDPDCTTIVMPIPYVDAGEGKVVYEGDQFPGYVPITHYEQYDLEVERPDIIYIHNPYDDTNTITSVFPRYFSENLKKITDMLVYIPYFIFGPHKNTSINSCLHYKAKATKYVDKIIAQSFRVKELFEYYGNDPNKIVALGSPKSDAVVSAIQNPSIIPEEWREKIQGKKVFLFNTHISNIPRYGELAIQAFEAVFEAVISNENCALIWRPHPLSETMLRAHSPQYLDKFNSMKKKISEAKNGIIDDTDSYLAAFCASDAMLSTYSSLIREYMITGKPILIIQKRRNPEIYINSPIDIFCNYFIQQDNSEIKEFVDRVLNGEDPIKNERMNSINKGLLNLDGTCGEKVHEYIKVATIEQL